MSSIFMKNNKKSVIPHSLLACLPVNVGLIAALIALDIFVLFDFFSSYSFNSEVSQYASVASIVVMLDGGSIIAGIILFKRLRSQTIERIALISIGLLILSAMVICGFLRLADVSIYEVEDMSAQDLFAAGGDLMTESTGMTPERTRLIMLTQILYIATPFYTSVINFCLSVLRSQYKFLLDIEKLEQRVATLQEKALTIQNSEIINQQNEQTDKLFGVELPAMLHEIDSRNLALKAKTKEIYIKYTSNLSDIHLAQDQTITAPPVFRLPGKQTLAFASESESAADQTVTAFVPPIQKSEPVKVRQTVDIMSANSSDTEQVYNVSPIFEDDDDDIDD